MIENIYYQICRNGNDNEPISASAHPTEKHIDKNVKRLWTSLSLMTLEASKFIVRERNG